MRIVIKDRRFKINSKPQAWKGFDLDYQVISPGLPLTQRAINTWQEHKSPLGYCGFRGLDIEDIKSILSAVKRQEARINVNRWGQVAYYKLINVGKEPSQPEPDTCRKTGEIQAGTAGHRGQI